LLNSIDAQTDITVFLRSGVPAELRHAALRRAWKVDPMIRNFRGLQENDWNFDDPNGPPGFGELGPEVNTKKMVAQIIRETPQALARGSNRQGFEIVLRLLRRLNITDSAVARD
jgi:hypothetical protein